MPVSAIQATKAPEAPESDKDDLDALERAPLTAAESSKVKAGTPAAGKALAMIGYGCISNVSDKSIGVAPEDDLLQGSEDGRYPALDIIRILCVWLVCVDHAGTPFGVWNTMFVQSWVLQYLFMICGICFGMTSKPLGGFLGRLGMYLVIGVCCNWCAWLYLGMDWRGGFWNVIFQFWFIVALIVFTLLLTPLKCRLAQVRYDLREGRQIEFAIPGKLLMLPLGYCAVGLFFAHVLIPILQWLFAEWIVSLVKNDLGPAAVFWGFPETVAESQDFIKFTMSYFQLSAENVYLVLVFPLLSRNMSCVAWLVLLNTYAHKMIQYRAQMARLVNGFDCMMLGLVCYYFGLKYRKTVGEYIVRYWFVCLFLCSVLFPPGTYGRFDESPPHDKFFRACYNLVECFFVVLFLSAVERMVDARIFTEDRLEFLGNWALILFLVHKAVHLVVPQPFNYCLLIGLAFPCYLLRKEPKAIFNSAEGSKKN